MYLAKNDNKLSLSMGLWLIEVTFIIFIDSFIYEVMVNCVAINL